MAKMRLQRVLARAGIASRRGAEELIREGRVRVNGQLAELGSSADPERDHITVGRRRVGAPRPAWIALNKPAGFAVTRRRGQDHPSVFDLIPRVPGLTYVGRLDVASVGLVLFTTDGDAANRLTHPRYQVERTYRVLARGSTPARIEARLRRPVVVEGRPAAITDYRVRSRGEGSTELVLTLTEGRPHIVRRVCDQLHLRVDRLIRVSHGPVQLGRLAPGEWRHLRPKEIQAIRDATARESGVGT